MARGTGTAAPGPQSMQGAGRGSAAEQATAASAAHAAQALDAARHSLAIEIPRGAQHPLK